jgi:hypothetical protein
MVTRVRRRDLLMTLTAAGLYLIRLAVLISGAHMRRQPS